MSANQQFIIKYYTWFYFPNNLYYLAAITWARTHLRDPCRCAEVDTCDHQQQQQQQQLWLVYSLMSAAWVVFTNVVAVTTCGHLSSDRWMPPPHRPHHHHHHQALQPRPLWPTFCCHGYHTHPSNKAHTTECLPSWSIREITMKRALKFTVHKFSYTDILPYSSRLLFTN